jgi:hypothetical protein
MGYEDDMDDAILQRERRQWIEGTLNDISEDNIRTYLGTYGDSIDGRIKASIRTATNLHAARYHAASVVAGVTAIELVVNYLLVRPLVQSAFMSDEWASLITRKIAFPRTVSDRNILPTILSYKAIDIASIKLKDGRHLWQTVTSEVISEAKSYRSRGRRRLERRSTDRHRVCDVAPRERRSQIRSYPWLRSKSKRSLEQDT